jgi:rubrerythrin
MANEEILAVLKQGISTELWGLRFYEEAAKRTASADGKKVFESLIVEEKKHLDILRGQWATVNGGKAWASVKEAQALAATVPPSAIFPEASAAQKLIPDGTTDEQALEMAMAFERRGYESYAASAKQTALPAAAQMWQYLAKAEDKHYEFLRKTHEYLKTNATWYFDDQERPFFEG